MASRRCRWANFLLVFFNPQSDLRADYPSKCGAIILSTTSSINLHRMMRDAKELKSCTALEQEVAWVTQYLTDRVEEFFASGIESHVPSHLLPDLSGLDEPYAQFVEGMVLSQEERIVLTLSLLPSFQPNALHAFKVLDNNRMPVTEFGGYSSVADEFARR